MAKFTQGVVNAVLKDHAPGTQLYDDALPGLRVVVGKKSASWKLVARINDKTDTYVSIILGRTNELSLKSARERASELRLSCRRGIDPRKPATTVPNLRQAYERFVESRGADLRPRTLGNYRQLFDSALKSLHKTRLDLIDRETVRTLHESLTEKRGPYLANGAMRLLKAVFNDCARSQDLPANPVSRGVRFNKSHARDWAVGPDGLPELWRKLDALENRLHRAAWLTMLLTGLRREEACSIRWENLDADGILFIPSPKGGSDRSFHLPLPRLLLQELARVKEETKKFESPYVFPAWGKKGYVQSIKRSDAFPFAPHGMRHTWRTAALEAGIALDMVMTIMNHRSQNVSFNYVTRAALLGPMKEAIEKVAASIAKHRGTAPSPAAPSF